MILYMLPAAEDSACNLAGEDRRERECVNVIQEESWGRIGERERVCERHSRGKLGEDRRERECV